MSLSIYKTKQESGIAAAKFGAAKIRAALAEKNECRIIRQRASGESGSHGVIVPSIPILAPSDK